MMTLFVDTPKPITLHPGLPVRRGIGAPVASILRAVAVRRS